MYIVDTEVPEVIDMLSKFAMEAGLKKYNIKYNYERPVFWFDDKDYNNLCDRGFVSQYKDERQIISIERAIELLKTPKIMIGSYKVEFLGHSIKVGCQEVPFFKIKEIVGQLGYKMIKDA